MNARSQIGCSSVEVDVQCGTHTETIFPSWDCQLTTKSHVWVSNYISLCCMTTLCVYSAISISIYFNQLLLCQSQSALTFIGHTSLFRPEMSNPHPKITEITHTDAAVGPRFLMIEICRSQSAPASSIPTICIGK